MIYIYRERETDLPIKNGDATLNHQRVSPKKIWQTLHRFRWLQQGWDLGTELQVPQTRWSLRVDNGWWVIPRVYWGGEDPLCHYVYSCLLLGSRPKSNMWWVSKPINHRQSLKANLHHLILEWLIGGGNQVLPLTTVDYTWENTSTILGLKQAETNIFRLGRWDCSSVIW